MFQRHRHLVPAAPSNLRKSKVNIRVSWDLSTSVNVSSQHITVRQTVDNGIDGSVTILADKDLRSDVSSFATLAVPGSTLDVTLTATSFVGLVSAPVTLQVKVDA